MDWIARNPIRLAQNPIDWPVWHPYLRSRVNSCTLVPQHSSHLIWHIPTLRIDRWLTPTHSLSLSRSLSQIEQSGHVSINKNLLFFSRTPPRNNALTTCPQIKTNLYHFHTFLSIYTIMHKYTALHSTSLPQIEIIITLASLSLSSSCLVQIS